MKHGLMTDAGWSSAKQQSDTSEMIENENQENEEEGLNMSQIARKVQGAIGWRSVTSLFSNDDEHRTDPRAEPRPEQAMEQPSSSRSPDNPSEKRSTALWDVFSSKWQQRSAERSEARGVLSEPPEEHNEAHQPEETPFRWNFLTSKLAELRSKGD
ncbi:uncharacterized protein C1orf232 homolog [Hyperolius riggenbachi]|uniref:uncharacterized protein C1orf232 homolog n=1 Tax=Hyperolius riggenbachi TaxID=752182 RepID=UPI0035A2CB69